MPADHVSNLVGKTVVGGGSAVAAVTTPSEYVSFFDRVYELGGFLISGDDLSRIIGMVVGILVGCNIVYTITKDVRGRGKRADRDKKSRK